MAMAGNLGFPRFGAKREWKRAVERYWKGKLSRGELLATADELTARHWTMQREAGIGIIPVNDFSFYDHVLDMTALLGAIPPRYHAENEDDIDIDTYFAMARGVQDETRDVRAMEMTKWFDTNYHYIVPEFDANTQYRLASGHPFTAVEKARAAGVEHPRPVLVGPATYLLLGKCLDGVSRLDLLDRLIPVYEQILRRFDEQGVRWVQVDEPWLVLDLDDEARELFARAYSRLNAIAHRPNMLVATYFGGVDHNAGIATALGDGLHLDLVRAPNQLEAIAKKLPEDHLLSLGVINGRNVWRTNLEDKLALLQRAADLRSGTANLLVAPSCSLLHCPIDLELETALDDELKSWLAFAKQKLGELHALTVAINGDRSSVEHAFAASAAAHRSREQSARVRNKTVRARQAEIDESMTRRSSPYERRVRAQREKLNLPRFPTTTIGSFPQTREVRRLRARLRKGEITRAQYEKAIEQEILSTLRFQEEAGVDVFVHGEFERNDMVEFFGEQFDGFAFTKHGWVQSYGSRGVKPPIIYGDVQRTHPVTVRWSKFAKDHTDRPVKGMLTGPVTIQQWSFVRDDQPRSETAEQIALAIRDEVLDLEAAGIDVIQIDEPAFREGLPLRKKDWPHYLDWAVRCFRIASSGVRDDTQIHSHMCYSEFNEIFDSIAALDADVISLEASRSRMELLDAFEHFHYPNDIGPGVWDIHSPRVPSRDEIADLLRRALKHIRPERLWVNPDCGLKTRGWEEVRESVRNLVDAAKMVRESES
ncbi:MAG: 5-methyltetrahydropteroyltriglutamate--homocysteine methyltransferase [Calditrichaeota bacterium]|nr:5-methyltetrahydropteroyltriglutamate--homocysteine methyltransferase [Calditrichota bacterium]